MKNIFTPALLAILILFQLIFVPPLHAQCWSALSGGAGTDPTNNGVYAMAVYNGDLYAVGIFDTVSGIAAPNIARWNGTAWSSVGATSGTLNSYANCSMAVYNGSLYVGGQFDSIGGVAVNNIAKWDGSTWSAVGSGIPTLQFSGNAYTINTLALYNGALYAGGGFDSAGGVAVNNIAKWDGSSWSDVGGGLDTAYNNTTGVAAMYVLNNVLYVGGNFAIAGGIPVNNIAAWNGSSWSAVGTGIGAPHQDGVTTIAGYQGNIHAGSFNFASSLLTVSKWTGSAWNSLAGNSSFGYVYNMVPYDGGLVAGGIFSSIDGVAAGNVAIWNGTIWSALNGGLSGGQQAGAYAADTFNAGLYVGGNFSQAGNINALNIAEYHCTTGLNEISGNHISICPNPTNGLINISVENIDQNTSIRIYDLMGEKIWQSKLNTNPTQLNLSGEPKGTYLYRVSGQNGQTVSSGSFVIQ